MAGRIRSIKPEILEDERSAGLSSDAWRLWVSMWLLADDHGRLRGNHHYLEGQVFWLAKPRESLAKMLESLASQHLIVRYEVNGQKYIEVRNWNKHQKVDHPGKPRVPSPEEGVVEENQQPGPISSRESRETLATPSESLATDLRSGPPTSDQDLRPRPVPAPVLEPPTPEPLALASPSAQLRATKPKVKNLDQWQKQAEPLLAELNAARKRVRPSSRDYSATTDNLRFIAERLQRGATEADVKHVILVREAECRSSPDAFQWFDAVTPFRPEPFAKAIGRDPNNQPIARPAPPPQRTHGPRPVGDFAPGLTTYTKDGVTRE